MRLRFDAAGRAPLGTRARHERVSLSIDVLVHQEAGIDRATMHRVAGIDRIGRPIQHETTFLVFRQRLLQRERGEPFVEVVKASRLGISRPDAHPA